MNKPLVSIIMGAYNCETTLKRAIDSIINQTYRNWEFIICNDCSTDNTLKILKEYQKNDERIIIISNEKNKKLAASLNNCLKKASGKYVARMDADDISLPTRIEKEVIFLESHPGIDVVGCGRIIFDEQGKEKIQIGNEYPKKNELLKGVPFAHPTIMMKKSVFDALGGYVVDKSTVRAEDLDLWFRFFKNGYKGYIIQEPLYRYHESLRDYKKRSIKAGIQTSKVFLRGYKLLEFPIWKRVWAIKPIISALLPDKIMFNYHKL